MKPSLLAIVFLTGTVYSRTIWDVFNLLFGSDEDSEDNSIAFDDENRHASNRKKENSADKGVGGKDINDILEDVDPYTQKMIEKKIDNRVGWSFPIKHDVSTKEGYKNYLEQLAQYLKNLSEQDHGLGHGAGPAYTQLDQRFGAYDEYGNFYWDDYDPFDDDGGGPDYGGDGNDLDDFGYDYGFGHDELK